jgi:hypothetical protein
MIFGSPWPPLRHESASVGDAVLGAAKQFGYKPVLIESETGRTLTYHQLICGAERVAPHKKVRAVEFTRHAAG